MFSSSKRFAAEKIPDTPGPGQYTMAEKENVKGNAKFSNLKRFSDNGEKGDEIKKHGPGYLVTPSKVLGNMGLKTPMMRKSIKKAETIQDTRKKLETLANSWKEVGTSETRVCVQRQIHNAWHVPFPILYTLTINNPSTYLYQ